MFGKKNEYTAFRSLFEKYDRLIVFDTETTGLDCRNDQIIEFACVVVEKKKGIVLEFDQLVQLAPGTLPRSRNLPALPPRLAQKRASPRPGCGPTLCRSSAIPAPP